MTAYVKDCYRTYGDGKCWAAGSRLVVNGKIEEFPSFTPTTEYVPGDPGPFHPAPFFAAIAIAIVVTLVLLTT